MFLTHKLRKDEDFKSVMRKHKVTDWKTTWGLPQNKRLRSKRKFVDQVQAGDTLVILDPKAKLRSVEFLGITYNVPDAEWDATKRSIVRVIEKKFLPELLALKKTYDDDYNYMWSIANKEGWFTGMLAAAVENLSGATVPTKEMSKVSKSVDAVSKAIRKGDFAKCVTTMGAAQTAMQDYVKAAEKYRSKVTNGATKGVEFLEITRDNAFLLVGAMATGGVGAAAPAAAFTALEIGAAVGGGTALVKSASNEVGNYMAKNKRTTQEITFAIVRDTYLGAAQGALGAMIFSRLGPMIVKPMAKYVQRGAPKIITVMLRENTIPSKWGQQVVAKYGEKATADLICNTAGRFAIAKIMTGLTNWFLSKEGLSALSAAANAVYKGLSGNEKSAAIGEKIAAKLDAQGATKQVVEAMLESSKSDIDKALKKKLDEVEAEAA